MVLDARLYQAATEARQPFEFIDLEGVQHTLRSYATLPMSRLRAVRRQMDATGDEDGPLMGLIAELNPAAAAAIEAMPLEVAGHIVRSWMTGGETEGEASGSDSSKTTTSTTLPEPTSPPAAAPSVTHQPPP